MAQVKLRVKVPEYIYEGLRMFCEKYNMSIDDAVAELLSRALLSEFFGIVLVPREIIENSKGVAVVDEKEGIKEIIPFESSPRK